MALIYPVILCGGTGARLWPLSRRSMPKQFLNFTCEDSLFQQAALRVSGPDFAAPIVITANDYRFVAAQQLADIGIKSKAVLLEPSPKNTAPAVLAAAVKLFDKDPHAVMLVVPSDHYIPDSAAFREQVTEVRALAEAEYVVTFGIQPDRPETGYGYIQIGQKLLETDGFSVTRFLEKPDANTAQKMIRLGSHLWNSGIFLVQCKTLLELAEQHVPNMLRCVKQSVNAGTRDLDFLRLEKNSWAEVDADSIDYAILEKAHNLAVFLFSGRWSDLGDWQAIMREFSVGGQSDSEGNMLVGKASQIDSHSCLIWSEHSEQIVTTVGVNDLIVVAMADAVLVVNKHQAQSVKRVIDLLDQKKISQAYEQSRQFRPWGWFEILVLADSYQVRRVYLYPKTQISMQKHERRSENWVITSGVADVQLGKNKIRLEQNESLNIPSGTMHQLSNNSAQPLTFIEVRTGKYFGDDDVLRVFPD